MWWLTSLTIPTATAALNICTFIMNTLLISSALNRVTSGVGTTEIDKLDFSGLVNDSIRSLIRVSLKKNKEFLDEYATSIRLLVDESDDDDIGILIQLRDNELHDGLNLSTGSLTGQIIDSKRMRGLSALLTSLESINDSPSADGGTVEVSFFLKQNVVFLNMGSLL